MGKNGMPRSHTSLRDFGRELDAVKRRADYICIECEDNLHVDCTRCSCYCNGEI